MSVHNAGVAAQHIAIARLIEAGRRIAVPADPQEKFDLLVWDKQRVPLPDGTGVWHSAWSRVQIKKAYRRGMSWRVDLRAWSTRDNRILYEDGDIEFIAAVCGQDLYLVPWDEVRGLQSFTVKDEWKDEYLYRGEGWD